MNHIHSPNDDFDFSKLHLLTPTVVTGGNHFIKFRWNEKPLYIQPPKCKTKQGIAKSGKRFYCDLLFSNENEAFVRWMENLETHCQKQIFENKTKWFETDLDENDIENFFSPCLKLFKSGKMYSLKANVPTVLGNWNLKIFNEEEEEVDVSTIKEENDVMIILEFQGIKCSPRNFQIEIELKQMMVLQPPKLFESCIFSKLQEGPATATAAAAAAAPIPAENGMKSNLGKRDEEPAAELPPPPCAEDASLLPETKDPFQTLSPREEEKDISLSSPIPIPTPPPMEESDICEIEFDLDEISPQETIQIKKRNDVYYQLYKEAKRKAKIARDLALSSYLEAKHIKNTFLLEDIEESDSDLDENSFQSLQQHSEK